MSRTSGGKNAEPVSVPGCCCGGQHRMSPSAWQKYQKIVAGRSVTLPVGNVYGCWRVPRLYIALHGLSAPLLRALADQYGWELVRL